MLSEDLFIKESGRKNQPNRKINEKNRSITATVYPLFKTLLHRKCSIVFVVCAYTSRFRNGT